MKALATIAASLLAPMAFGQSAPNTPQKTCTAAKTHAELDRRMTERAIWSTEVLAYVDERKSPKEHSPGTARITLKSALDGLTCYKWRVELVTPQCLQAPIGRDAAYLSSLTTLQRPDMSSGSPAFLEPSAEQEFMVEFDHSATIGNERATLTYDYPCYADGDYGTIRGHFKVSLRATNNTDV